MNNIENCPIADLKDRSLEILKEACEKLPPTMPFASNPALLEKTLHTLDARITHGFELICKKL